MKYSKIKIWILPLVSFLSVIITIIYLFNKQIFSTNINIEQQNILYHLYIIFFLVSYLFLFVSTILTIYGIIKERVDVLTECQYITKAGVALLVIGIILMMLWLKLYYGFFIMSNRIMILSILLLCPYLLFLHLNKLSYKWFRWLLLFGGILVIIHAVVLFHS